MAAQQVRHADPEEAPAGPGQHQGREHRLHPGEAACAEKARHRMVEARQQMAPHVEDDDRGRQHGGDDQVAAECGRLPLPPIRVRGVRCGTERTRLVAGLPHGRLDITQGDGAGGVVQFRPAGGEVHARRDSTGKRHEGALHASDTGGAAHPLDGDGGDGFRHVVAGFADCFDRPRGRQAIRQGEGGAAGGEIDGDVAHAGQRAK